MLPSSPLVSSFLSISSIMQLSSEASKTSIQSDLSKYPLLLDPFVFKSFPELDLGDMTTFTHHVNTWYTEQKKSPLVDGYAPFCKHIFIKNFTNAPCPVLPIDSTNTKLIESGYKSRRSNELPVLSRWIPASKLCKGQKTGKEALDTAKYLHIILYHKTQIVKEHGDLPSISDITAPKGLPLTTTSSEYEYGIISVKPQNLAQELPMNPITQMRNALGTEEGGSGIKINRKKYQESVDYWNNHVLVDFNL